MNIAHLPSTCSPAMMSRMLRVGETAMKVMVQSHKGNEPIMAHIGPQCWPRHGWFSKCLARSDAARISACYLGAKNWSRCPCHQEVQDTRPADGTCYIERWTSLNLGQATSCSILVGTSGATSSSVGTAVLNYILYRRNIYNIYLYIIIYREW